MTPQCVTAVFAFLTYLKICLENFLLILRNLNGNNLSYTVHVCNGIFHQSSYFDKNVYFICHYEDIFLYILHLFI